MFWKLRPHGIVLYQGITQRKPLQGDKSKGDRIELYRLIKDTQSLVALC